MRILFFILLSIAGIASAHAELIIRISHVVAEDTPKGAATIKFKQLVEERSKKAIRVEIYPLSTLYDDDDEMLALQLGAVEIIAPSLSKFGRFGFPSFELFDLPFFFESLDAVHKVTNGPVGARLLKDLDKQQFIGLGFMDNGFKHMSANRPLIKPADYSSLRMRIQPSRIIAAQMQALGARPVSLALSETRLAITRGVVDGTENPVSNFITQKIDEVQTHLTLSSHGYLGYVFLANRKFWMALSTEDRNLLEKSLAEALAFGNEKARNQENIQLAKLESKGKTQIVQLTEAQRNALRAQVEPVYKMARTRIGTEILDAANKAVAKKGTEK